MPFVDGINEFNSKRLIESVSHHIARRQFMYIFGTVVSLVAMCAFYWHKYGEENKQTLSKTASEIGKGALSDEELVKTAEKLSLNIVHGVLNDEHIREEVTRLLSGVVRSQPVLDSAKVLVNNLLGDAQVQSAIGQVLYNQLVAAINHPTIQENLSRLVLTVLQKEVVMDQLKVLTRDLFTSEEITHTVKTVLGDAIVTEYVKQAGKKLGLETTNAIILDPEVQKNLSGRTTVSIFKHWLTVPIIDAFPFRCNLRSNHTVTILAQTAQTGCED